MGVPGFCKCPCGVNWKNEFSDRNEQLQSPPPPPVPCSAKAASSLGVGRCPAGGGVAGGGARLFREPVSTCIHCRAQNPGLRDQRPLSLLELGFV